MRDAVRKFVAVVSLVALTCLLALIVFPVGRPTIASSTDFFGLAILILLAFLLSGLSATIVTSAGGRAFSSVAAIPYLALLPLFGPLITAISTVVGEGTASVLIRRLPKGKVLFNAAQLIIAVSLAGLAYTALGREISTRTFTLEPRTLLAFAVTATVFFGVNLSLVTAVVALNSSERFRRTWQLVTVGIWPGDLAAGTLALLLAFLYARYQLVGVLALLLPLLFLHHSNAVNVRLHQLNRDLLRLMIKTIEAKDPYTSGHSIRVAHLSRRIAEELRLPRRLIDAIDTAALLHDFGKIDVAYGDIILHPGPLTAEQRSAIQSHSARGAELLASISTLDTTITDAVRHHHEHFDGSGYPDGLAGEAIPIGARIVMVADTVDAMLSVRPYRPALSVAVVQEELRRYSSKQFDPTLVEVLLRSGILRDFASREVEQGPSEHVPPDRVASAHLSPSRVESRMGAR